jgi:hypothetical protein
VFIWIFSPLVVLTPGRVVCHGLVCVCVCVCVFVCVMMDAEKFFAYVALCRVVFSYCLRRKHKKWGQLEPIWYRALGIPWCLTVLSTWRVLCAALLGTSRDGNGMGARSG